MHTSTATAIPMAPPEVQAQTASVSLPMTPAATGRRVTLPGGVLDADRRYRVIELRELTGADEEILCGQFESGAQQVTALLSRAIARIEGLNRPIDAALVANMLVGDRDYLLLRMRQMEVGDEVHEVVRCRAQACGKKVDVDFLISELPVRQCEALSTNYAVPLIDAQGVRHSARLRLPTGADLAAVAPLIASNPGAANSRLYARIVESLEGYPIETDEQARNLPLRLRAQIAEFIERSAPGPDLFIDVDCPHCGADLAYTFDLHSFFLPSAR